MNGISAEFAAALIKATSQIEGVTKDASNPYYKSKYADLPSVIQAVKKPLNDNGITFIQKILEGASAKIETILIYKTGESLSLGIIELPIVKSDPQGMGSAITYARRYSLATGLGVPAFDDDGNEASGIEEKPHYYFWLKFSDEQKDQLIAANGIFKDGIWKTPKSMGNDFVEYEIKNKKHFDDAKIAYAKYLALFSKKEGEE